MLTEREKERYSRHLLISELGTEGQQKLKAASVLVIGAGGLGCPVLQYLTAAGIGKIGIVDADVVSLSNLQRQILFTEDEIGSLKAEMAANRLSSLNSTCQFEVFPHFLDDKNAESIISKYDIVVGCTDNFSSRYLIDAVCSRLKRPFVHGSIHEFEGQVAVFHYGDGQSSYSRLFPEEPDGTDLSLGVMGVLPGIIGSLQGCEVIKIITGVGEVLSDQLAIYNSLSNSFTRLSL